MSEDLAYLSLFEREFNSEHDKLCFIKIGLTVAEFWQCEKSPICVHSTVTLKQFFTCHIDFTISQPRRGSRSRNLVLMKALSPLFNLGHVSLSCCKCQRSSMTMNTSAPSKLVKRNGISIHHSQALAKHFCSSKVLYERYLSVEYFCIGFVHCSAAVLSKKCS